MLLVVCTPQPASDLSVFSAIYSSFKMKPLPHDAIFFGEIGLSGEIRPIVKGQERIHEAQSHGFKKYFCHMEMFLKPNIMILK